MQTGMSPAQSDVQFRTGASNDPLETHLLHHGRLRRLGPLDEEQVEVGPLLGRGSFGRVYKGAPCSSHELKSLASSKSTPAEACIRPVSCGLEL